MCYVSGVTQDIFVGYSVTVWVGAEHFHEFIERAEPSDLEAEQAYWLTEYGADVVQFDPVYEDRKTWKRWVDGEECASCAASEEG